MSDEITIAGHRALAGSKAEWLLRLSQAPIRARINMHPDRWRGMRVAAAKHADGYLGPEEPEHEGWRMCEGCAVRGPDVRGTAWSDHDWCDDCNGSRRR